MAGLGAYGGAGLAGGLMGAGAGAAQNAEIARVMNTPEYAGAVADELGNPVVTQGEMLGQAAKDATNRAMVNPFAQGSTTSITDALKTNLGTMGEGFSNPSAAMNSMGGGMGLAKYAGAAAAPMLMNQETNFPGF